MTRRSLVALALVAVGWSSLWALVPRERFVHGDSSGDRFSPLFARRLETSVLNMDAPAGLVRLAAMPRVNTDPVGTPLSWNPLSACALSVCGLSGCLLSGCGLSGCLVSGCGASGCIESGCGTSVCMGSLCGGSGCLGSACGGSACFGTACSNCLISEDPGAGPE